MMLRRINISLILLMLLVVTEAQAQTAGSFARLGFSARGMAMGNALTSDVTGNVSPYYNPALAPFATRQNLQASVGVMTFDRQLQTLQFASSLPPKAGIALGVIHAGVTDIDGRTESGYHTETLSTDEFNIFLSFGLKISERFTFGLALQIFRSDLLDDLEPVNSAGLDVGLTIGLSETLRLGLVADDLLAAYSWDTSGLFSEGGKRTTDNLPRRLRVGLSKQLMEGKLLVLADYEAAFSTQEYRVRSVEIRDNRPIEFSDLIEATQFSGKARLGGEYRLSDQFALRAGLDDIGTALEEVRPGVGFQLIQPLGQLTTWIEYAGVLEPYGTGTLHMLTLRLFL